MIDSGEYVAQNEFFLERTLHSSCHRRPAATVLGQKMRTGRGVMPKGLFLLSDGWEDRKPSKYIFILTIKIIKNQSETVNRSSKDAFVQLANADPQGLDTASDSESVYEGRRSAGSLLGTDHGILEAQ